MRTHVLCWTGALALTLCGQVAMAQAPSPAPASAAHDDKPSIKVGATLFPLFTLQSDPKGTDVNYRGHLAYTGDRYGLQLERLLVGTRFDPGEPVDFTIFNPPFNASLDFVRVALRRARRGVAALVEHGPHPTPGRAGHDRVTDSERALLDQRGDHGAPALVEERLEHVGPGRTYGVGHEIVGDGCVIGNSSELKHSLLFNGCQVPHFNYVGDSILGHKAHLGAGVILFDPIFQGLAISLMAGELASLLLSRMAVPVFYYMVRRRDAATTPVVVPLTVAEQGGVS